MTTGAFNGDEDLDDDVAVEDLSALDEDYDGGDDALADKADDDKADADPADDDEADDEADDDDGDDDEEDENDDEEAEESLDVLLAREKVLDEDDVARITEEPREGLNVRTVPVGAGEFTCRSCFLVKRRAQLADEERLYCFDCA